MTVRSERPNANQTVRHDWLRNYLFESVGEVRGNLLCQHAQQSHIAPSGGVQIRNPPNGSLVPPELERAMGTGLPVFDRRGVRNAHISNANAVPALRLAPPVVRLIDPELRPRLCPSSSHYP